MATVYTFSQDTTSVVRRNLVPNPRPNDLSMWNGSGATRTISSPYLRSTATGGSVVQAFPLAGSDTNTPSGLNRFAISSNQNVALSVMVRNPGASTFYVRLGITFHNAAGTSLGGTIMGAYQTIAAGAAVRVYLTGTVPNNASIAGALPVLYGYSSVGGANATAGTQYDSTQWDFEKGVNAPTGSTWVYNDAFNSNTESITYSWYGAPSMSASIMQEVVSQPIVGNLGEVLPGWSVRLDTNSSAPGDSSGGLGGASFSNGPSTFPDLSTFSKVSLDTGTSGTFSGRISGVGLANSPAIGGSSDIIISSDAENLNSDVTVKQDAEAAYAGRMGSVYGYPVVIAGSNYNIPEPVSGYAPPALRWEDVYAADTGEFYGVFTTFISPYANALPFLVRWDSQGVVEYVVPCTQDLSSPGIGYSVANSSNLNSVFVLSKGASGGSPHIEKFSAINGSYQGVRWGTAGTGNGQFNLPTGLDVDTAGNVYVTDEHRVQVFDPSGAYASQFGGFGLRTVGQFNRPLSVSIDRSSNTVYVLDSQPTIQAFTASGSNVTPPVFGNFTSGSGAVVAEYGATGALNGSQVLRKMTVQQVYFGGGDAGSLRIYVSESAQGGGPYMSLRALGRYGNLLHTTGLYPRSNAVNSDGKIVTIDETTISESTNHAKLYIGVARSLSTKLRQYFSVAANLSITYTGDDPIVSIGDWSGNAWDRIKDLLTAYGKQYRQKNGVIYVENIVNSPGLFPVDTTLAISGSVAEDIDGKPRGKRVKFRNYNATSGKGVLHDTYSSPISIKVQEVKTIEVATEHSPWFVAPLGNANYPEGFYSIIDSNNLVVSWSNWESYGGSVQAQFDAASRTIRYTVIGPGNTIPGTSGEYWLAQNSNGNRVGTLKLYGYGVFSYPTDAYIYTGADPKVVTNDIAFSVDNIAHESYAVINKRASWTLAQASGPSVSVRSVTKPGLLGDSLGTVFPFRQSLYRVTSATHSATGVSLQAVQHSTVGEVDSLWASSTVGARDAFWNGYTVADSNIRSTRK